MTVRHGCIRTWDCKAGQIIHKVGVFIMDTFTTLETIRLFFCCKVKGYVYNIVKEKNLGRR